MFFTQKTGSETDAVRIQLLEATLRHATATTRYYREAFAGLSLEIESLEDLRRFPLLDRETLVNRGLDLLEEGILPEYVGITSGTTFNDSTREPLLHYQTETEHAAWISIYSSLEQHANERPLMLRLTDADRGLEVAGAFRGCFSLPLENPYHLALIISILKRDWSFVDCTRRIMSLSGALDSLQLLTLSCMEQGVDPEQFGVCLVSSSGWQMTNRWRGLLESYWRAEIQDVYGISEAPGMFAARCAVCSHFHFSPFSIIEVLRLDGNDPVIRGIGRVVVTCVLPVAHAQPIIRYDSGDVIEVVDGCQPDLLAFEYIGRRSKLIFVNGSKGPELVLSPLTVTDILDSLPDVAIFENLKARKLALRSEFGWPKYSLVHEKNRAGLRIGLDVELRWSPMQFPPAAEELLNLVRSRLLHSSPALAAAVDEGTVQFEMGLKEPGTIS